MGGSAPTQANTSNTSQSNTTIGGSVGLTGSQFQNVANTIVRTNYQSLTEFLRAYTATANSGFEFSRASIADANATSRHIADVGFDTLNSVTNAARDISARQLATTSGQSTPLQSLPAAGNQDTAGSDKSTNLIIILSVVALAVTVLK